MGPSGSGSLKPRQMVMQMGELAVSTFEADGPFSLRDTDQVLKRPANRNDRLPFVV